jgi:spore maturation protein SpmA
MATIGGPENSSWCLVVFILRGKQSKLLAVVSWLGVYILSVGMMYVVDSIGVVEMCSYILKEHKYILLKE